MTRLLLALLLPFRRFERVQDTITRLWYAADCPPGCTAHRWRLIDEIREQLGR